MELSKHFGIYLGNNADKNSILNKLHQGLFFENISSNNSVTYTNTILNEYLDLEERHGQCPIVNAGEKQLLQMSSGQQKWTFINYLINQKPSIIILDDLFANLDIANQKLILDKICGIANEIVFIQIFQRKKHLLPFIEEIFVIENEKVSKLNLKKEFLDNFEITNETKPIGNLPTSFRRFSEFENPLILFKNVSVKYEERPIITNINWAVNKGEFWQLIGPNGSGKSTIITMIVGDNPKAYGQDISLFGRKKGTGETVWQIKNKIGYFTTGMVLGFSKLETVANMVISGLNDSVGLYIKPTDMQIKTANDWLVFLGIEQFSKSDFNSLQTGIQRIVLIARAMIKQPPLLILDEPTVGLDDENIEIFVSVINKIAALKTTAIIYVSHQKEVGLEPHKVFELFDTGSGYGGKTKILD